jgi:predicted house-cleaning noncanonical NTP pyrophosphatase (MazG superfamily)
MTKYDKLVRDKIPKIITSNGEIAVTEVIADDMEYRRRLRQKLIEELTEYDDTPSVEEMADILEVLKAMQELDGLKADDIARAQTTKFLSRGGFAGRIVLVSTDTKA